MMLALEGDVSEVYLQPGESHLARKPTIIRTILGSCVGMSFWSARLGVGDLCHCQLPRCPANPFAGLSPVIGRRYVDFAIRDLARQFDELGVLRSEVQVKLFGGADVLAVNNSISSKPTVGRLNCEAAIEVVEAEGFNVAASSLGWTSGLNIQFDTRTGEVRLRRLRRALSEDILEE
jgi:chemotaxis protein CheD